MTYKHLVQNGLEILYIFLKKVIDKTGIVLQLILGLHQ